ncbi:TIGR02186 family protein [Pseudooceanicola nanhaiensis]|uniref:TIGR02186 family protein n=1 Tax=Pseudooceanicola nanhaiensis TaxID=375761 RepID=UPI001CD77742|nr:TIGR02186 family protein [Pseudooceanicola nanhaiensis]MCA0918961.1 TIGR02186 family protein [Pseudooceanicola nanhaiensis]
MRIAALLLLLLISALPLRAQDEEVVLGLSQNRVAITASFDGSEILVFGAVKRQTPIPETPMEVIITVAGPDGPVTLHRKARKAGIWVNADTVRIDRAPSFYAVATTGPLGKILSQTEDLRHEVSIPRAVRSVGVSEFVADPGNFTEALIRIREDEGVYQQLEGAVTFDQQTLFRTKITLPSNLTEGSYPTRIFLTRDGRVVSHFETVIDVRKVGLERWLFALSKNQPVVYGILSLVIAVVAGWLASAVFRWFRS